MGKEIKILAFGVVREVMNGSSIVLSLTNEVSLFEVHQTLKAMYPELENYPTLAFAVNEEYVEPEYEVSDKDVVAIIPPVSGG